MDLTILIISSPSPSHPSLYLIQTCIESLQLIPELCQCNILVLLDGFTISTSNRTKKGRITYELSEKYEEYYHRLQIYLAELAIERNINCQVQKLSSHHGFAFCVKHGLECIQTTYSLVLQHDRVFVSSINYIWRILKLMQEYEWIRYVGFSTSTSCQHKLTLQYRYKLDCLLNNKLLLNVYQEDITNIQIGYLLPLIFWFDSQHIAHVKRYLEIFYPFKYFPQHLQSIVGHKVMKDMVLRRGDFIEDRFGQCQRNMLTNNIIQDQNNIEIVQNIFLWYGSYLLWIPNDDILETCSEVIEKFHLLNELERFRLSEQPCSIMVRHLKGRQLDIEKISKIHESLQFNSSSLLNDQNDSNEEFDENL